MRNLRISTKLILGFALIAFLSGFVGYVSLYLSQKTLEQSIGEHSKALAVGILDNVDKEIEHHVISVRDLAATRSVREAVAESNAVFGELEDPDAYINQEEAAWVTTPNGELSPFMTTLIENPTSVRLREWMATYTKGTQSIFGEVFITNAHGAIVAQSGRTSDYRQDDEEWWRVAWESGLHIRDIAYDESADVYSTDVSVRIESAEGTPIGVVKAVLNIANVLQVMEESEGVSNFTTGEIKLINEANRVLYDSAEEYAFLTDMTSEGFLEDTKDAQSGYTFVRGTGPDAEEGFLAFSRSDGYRDFPGLGWLLVLEYDRAELLAPVARLQLMLLALSSLVMVVGIALGFLFARSIAKSIVRARNAAVEIARGNMEVAVPTDGTDEFGELSRALERMRQSLKAVMDEYERTNAAAEARVKDPAPAPVAAE